MTIHEEKARELFLSGANCAQAVFAAFADVMEISESEALRISAPFGAGMGKMRDTCGALSGALMAAGELLMSDVTDHEHKVRHYAMTREIAAEFKALHGTYVCREILGLEPGQDPVEPAIRTREYYESRPCLGCVGLAARLIDERLEKK